MLVSSQYPRPENVVTTRFSFPLKAVLLVDDLEYAGMNLKWFLTLCGYPVDSVCSAKKAIAVFDPVIHDLVVTGNSIPGMGGAALAGLIKRRSPRTPVVMYTSKPPLDCSCLDSVIQISAGIVELKAGIEGILADWPRIPRHPAFSDLPNARGASGIGEDFMF